MRFVNACVLFCILAPAAEAAEPAMPALYTPAPGKLGSSIAPYLALDVDVYPDTSWRIEVFKDAGLTELVEQHVLTRDNLFFDYDVSQEYVRVRTRVLEPGTEYFWRARTENPCGVSAWTAPWSFTTSRDLLLGEEVYRVGNLLYLDVDVIGAPDVAPADRAGAFVVAYPTYTNEYFNEFWTPFRAARVEVVGAPGGPAETLDAVTLPDGYYWDDWVKTPVTSTVDDREFLVVWGGTAELTGNRLSADGTEVGPAQQTIDTSPDLYTFPDAATNENTGEQLVVWLDRNASPRITAQRLASDGSTAGSSFQVNSSTFTPHRLAVAWNPDSQDFLVAWESFGADADDWSVVGRRLASDATPMGADFVINADTTGAQRNPSVSPLAGADSFLVVWESATGAGTDQDGWSIQGRVVEAAGPTGPDFQVNTVTGGNQRNPDVAVEPNWGGLLATWQSQSSAGNDNSGWSIQARRLEPDGVPSAADFQVNLQTGGHQYNPRVAANPGSKDFLVVWQNGSQILAQPVEGQVTFFADGFESGDTSAWTLTQN